MSTCKGYIHDGSRAKVARKAQVQFRLPRVQNHPLVLKRLTVRLIQSRPNGCEHSNLKWHRAEWQMWIDFLKPIHEQADVFANMALCRRRECYVAEQIDSG